MRNLKLIFLALLVSVGFIKANDNTKRSDTLDSELSDGGPIGHNQCW